MTIYDKPFKTYNEQIELLKSRGLIVEDYGFAYHALSTLSYYDLITRYQRYFMPDGKKFIDNITIELLYNFSLFDRSVQAFILKYSLLIENIVKTKLSHIMAKDFGVNEAAYLSASKYRESFKLPNNESLKFSSLAFECKKAIIDPKIARDPTLYYHRKHNHIPPWILLKNLSFNNTISLIKLLRNKQQNRIINELVPFPQVRLRDKTNFVFCSLGAIRLFHDFAACNLDFTTLYTYEINHLSSTILSKLGQYLHFYDFCRQRYSRQSYAKELKERLYLLWTVKDLRNACAHNNCIINDFRAPTSAKTIPSQSVNNALINLGISTHVRRKHLRRIPTHQIITTFYTHTLIVSSPEEHNHVVNELQNFKKRLFLNSDYTHNDIIYSSFKLLEKLIDNWFIMI